MPFAPFTCWSTGVATDCSTVRASAPVYVAVVWIWGGAISGNCAIGSRKIMTAPAIIVRIARTCATIGCSMKNLDTGVLSPHRGRRGWGCGGRVRFRTDGDTVLHLLQSLRHDAFAWLEPLVDDPEPVHLLARLHGAERDLVVRSDDGDLVHALGLLHRTLRYDEGTMERLRGGAYLGVEAGAKDGVGIREEGLHQDRSPSADRPGGSRRRTGRDGDTCWRRRGSARDRARSVPGPSPGAHGSDPHSEGIRAR